MTALRRAAGVTLGGVLLTLAAFTFDASPLFVAGGAFTLLGVLMPVWVLASAQAATVRRVLPADRAVEGEPVEAMIEVRRGPLGLPGGEVRDPLAGTPISLSAPLSLLAGHTKAEVRVVARFPRRGLRRLEPPALIVRDALELASRTVVGSGPPQEVLVLPRTEPVRWNDRRRGLHVEGVRSLGIDEPMVAVEVDGLRPYRPGTPASRIHWPALARGAGLLERRLQADGDTRPLVALDARCTGPAEHLDAAVRAAASLTLELARTGGCRLLLPGERRPVTVDADLAAWPGVHARLALIEGGPTVRPPLLGTGATQGPVLYIVAQLPDRLPSGARRGGRGGDWIVVIPSALTPSASAASFEVAGCRGFVAGARGVPAGDRAA